MDELDIYNGNGGGGTVYDQVDFTTVLQTLVNAAGNTLADRITMGGSEAGIPNIQQTSLAPLGAGVGAAALLGLGSLPALGRAAGAALGVIRSVGGRILGWVLPSGRRVSRKAAVSMAKQFGLVSAAAAVGASVEDLAQAVLDEETKPRRGRGITAAQLRVTTRTMAKIERAHKQIARAARAHK